MTCAGRTSTFRLFDANVGWEVADGTDLDGFNDSTGVHLKQKNPDAVNLADLLAYLPPARLARGCGPCTWYLITPSPPQSRLLGWDTCQQQWMQVRVGSCPPPDVDDAVAVAARRRRLAVADRGTGSVRMWTRGGQKSAGEIAVKNPGPMAFTPWGELLVTSQDSRAILRYGVGGDRRGELPGPLPGASDRIAVGSDGCVYVVTRLRGGELALWRASRTDGNFQPASIEQLKLAFAPTGITAADEVGFCWSLTGADGFPVTSCFSWYGRPMTPGEIKSPTPPLKEKRGQLLTKAIDSVIPRCVWHRVRIDADVPSGATIAVSVATSETKYPPQQGQPEQESGWTDFPAGVPHQSDWQEVPPGALDFLIDQPAGRYLFLRMRMTGDGLVTPVARRIRVDFPRVTSLDFLPSVYRETPDAEDFTARFLSLFDASIGDVDRTVERYPALLDPQGVPDTVLPWLGTFFDVTFDPAWDAVRRRRILAAIPQLYRWRGTTDGLRQAVQVVFDVDPVIEELGRERQWGALGRQTRLRAVRVFGKAGARMRLGASPLGSAPVQSHGNPDLDPFRAEAYRLRISIPPGAGLSGQNRDRLIALVNAQKPAHTMASIRVGGTGFLVGLWSTVGVDTGFAPLPGPILGRCGNVRLRRASVLWAGPTGPSTGPTVGQTSVVGIGTVME
jgi:phage tail-like protein